MQSLPNRFFYTTMHIAHLGTGTSYFRNSSAGFRQQNLTIDFRICTLNFLPDTSLTEVSAAISNKRFLLLILKFSMKHKIQFVKIFSTSCLSLTLDSRLGRISDRSRPPKPLIHVLLN